MNTVQDKVIMITGAGKGSGGLLARALAERGAIIAANDISPINVEQVVEEINRQGGRARAYIEDVAKKVGVQNLINQVEDDLGRIDILIHHAAVQPHVSLLEMDEWDWHRVLDVNLTGAFLVTQSAARVMRVKGGGEIIFLLTGTARDEENEAAFVASMSALAAFARQAARELRPHGIRVRTVQNEQGSVVKEVLALFESEAK
jgi:NAD(P)-dependent dehydrogenase (short-subunit alcohol dehydrogenase family)